MKINHIKSSSRIKLSHKNGLFLNLYYFFCFYRYVFFVLVGLVFSAFITLVTIDFLTPSLLKDIDKETTLALFKQLQNSNRHQDAITLMEYKGGMLKDDLDRFKYNVDLSNSYIKVGDYSTAEKVLLDLREDKLQFVEMNVPQKEKEKVKAMANFSFGRIIYQLYEKMGDTKNQQHFFEIYKNSYDSKSHYIDSLMITKDNNRDWPDLKTTNARELVEYDSIVVSSFINKTQAIDGMSEYVDKIIEIDGFAMGYKLKCINKLIGWHLENNHLIQAYSRISQAVDLVKHMNFSDDFEGLGVLSDYCFKIHDYPMSKALYNKYEKYVEENFSETDIEFLANQVRRFRFLEKENKIEDLFVAVEQYCVGMRNQIAINMPSMSSEQRECFAQTFNLGYDYAFSLLKSHPNKRMANLCFDNVIFKTGLLLRSDISLKNSVYSMNDDNAKVIYEDLDSCRRELIYQSVSGKRFFNKETQLNERIDFLEKQLALISTDFKHKNDVALTNYKVVQDRLNGQETMIELIQHDDDLVALVLKSEGDVDYVPLCRLQDIDKDLQRPIFQIYHDAEFTDKLVGKLSTILDVYKSVYYIPNGIFNQLAMGTLYLGNNQYVYDKADIKLLSNPTSILSDDDLILKKSQNYISLWGGIDYGGTLEFVTTPKTRTALKRGDNLSRLRYSSLEVQKIASMLTEKSFPTNLYMDSLATENTFKDRDNQNDYVLHISTHGFFNDKVDSSKSMYESGLFFAGANRYWTNDSIIASKNEEDGILRAAEISTMNLTNCSMVVLSACETGLGFSHSSEGVYGLQRAFKLAGVNQVLMSLWEVDDRATERLMTEFYERLLTGKSSDQALKESKDALRKKWNYSAEYWGGFVLLH